MADNKLAPQSKNKLPWYEQALPMKGRATFLPFQDTLPGSVMNTRSFALPGIIAGAANAITAPGRAYSGSDPMFDPQEEAANFAMNVMGGGIGASRAAPAPAGSTGLAKARENNTFVYDRNDTSKGYGRSMGFPQPAGTSSDRLFSNFADDIKTPGAADKFRSDMLARTLKNPNQIANEVVTRSVIPFKDNMYVIVDAADKGNTRLQVIKNNAPVAGARLQKGLLDSIAVDESAKGQRIGSDLLQFIHDTKIGNVLEVPDRSPGFVKIQKDLIKKLELTN